MDLLFSYVEEKIFNNNNVNFAIDKIFLFLNQKLEVRAEALLILSGRASAFLQSETTEVPKQVVLITNDETVFQYLSANAIPDINCIGTVFFKERLLFYFKDFFLEIWLSEEESLSIIEQNGIYCHEYSQIPEILL